MQHFAASPSEAADRRDDGSSATSASRQPSYVSSHSASSPAEFAPLDHADDSQQSQLALYLGRYDKHSLQQLLALKKGPHASSSSSSSRQKSSPHKSSPPQIARTSPAFPSQARWQGGSPPIKASTLPVPAVAMGPLGSRDQVGTGIFDVLMALREFSICAPQARALRNLCDRSVLYLRTSLRASIN